MADTLQNFIDGHFVPAHGEKTLEIVDPATGRTVAVSPVSNQQDVDAAFEAALTASRTWRKTTPAERQEALLKLADALQEHRDELVEAQHRNTGQPRAQIAEEEVDAGTDNLRFFAGAARTLEGRAAMEYMSENTSYVRREPVGAVSYTHLTLPTM